MPRSSQPSQRPQEELLDPPRPTDEADLGSGSLRSRTVRGLLWASSTQLVAQALHLAVRLLLARLLAPADFGLVAMAMVAISLSMLTLDFGFTTALVQRPELRQQHLCTCFWANVLMGVGLSAALFAGAPLVGAFFQDPKVTPLVRGLSPIFLLAAPEAVYAALLQRGMDFRTLGQRRIITIVVAGSVGITLALLGFGVWSLVTAALLEPGLGSLFLAVRSPWRPRWIFSGRAFRELWSFGGFLMGARLLNFFNRNLDTVLVGRFLGASDLGLYALAYQAVTMPFQLIGRPIAQVSFPAFAKLAGNRRRLRLAYLQSLRLILVLTLPLATLGILGAPALIPWILGELWQDAVVPFQILSAVMAVQILASLSPSVFNGLGRSDVTMRWTVAVLVANALGFSVGLLWGLRGVAVGYLAATLLVAPLHFGAVGRLIPVPATCLLGVPLRGLVPAVAMLGVGYAATGGQLVESYPGRLAVSLAAGLAVYAGLTLALLPEVRHEVLGMWARLRGGSPAATCDEESE